VLHVAILSENGVIARRAAAVPRAMRPRITRFAPPTTTILSISSDEVLPGDDAVATPERRSAAGDAARGGA
jgi:hypothetical protein